MKKTIQEIYNNCEANQITMLSDFAAPFWEEYRVNHIDYDRMFARMFGSFVYFNQTGEENIDDLTSEFILDIRSFLLLNQKKYAELWRVEQITDEEYSITENYHTIEEGHDTLISGERIDSSSGTLGERTSESTGQVTTYDSHSFNDNDKTIGKVGSQTNSGSSTKGAETDEITKSYTKHGNIGVQTGSDMLQKHLDVFKNYEFYRAIFKEICAEFLLVGGDC